MLERVCAAVARPCLEKPARREKLPAAFAEGREQLKGTLPDSRGARPAGKNPQPPHPTPQRKNNPGEPRPRSSITFWRCRWCAEPGGASPGVAPASAADPQRERWGRSHCLQPRGVPGAGGHGQRRSCAARSCLPPRRALPAPSPPGSAGLR